MQGFDTRAGDGARTQLSGLDVLRLFCDNQSRLRPATGGKRGRDAHAFEHAVHGDVLR
jgi:hypothetical protein